MYVHSPESRIYHIVFFARNHETAQGITFDDQYRTECPEWWLNRGVNFQDGVSVYGKQMVIHAPDGKRVCKKCERTANKKMHLTPNSWCK